MSFMYNMNKNGPSKLPCGTAAAILRGDDILLLGETTEILYFSIARGITLGQLGYKSIVPHSIERFFHIIIKPVQL